ncbi:Amidophosphoribosyltransferase [bacterium HR11]|nr:Amidophosphoribosyltransferase [bacterium HR11]
MCGVFGVWNHPEAAHLTYMGLYALQHRGQESAGIVTADGERLFEHKGMGYVSDVFTEDVLKKLPGHLAIGHVRYSTAGRSFLQNAQPLVAHRAWGSLAIAHNGNIVNALSLRESLERDGAIFSTTTDTEVILHLVARSRRWDLVDAILWALHQLKGAFTLVILTPDTLIGVRDPYGFRPLWLGRKDGAWVLASETSALDLIDAVPEREVQPGEVIVINEDGIQSLKPFPAVGRAQCIFELVYFSRPDSVIFGRSVSEARVEMGRWLAREAPADADIVVPVPDSGVHAAIGYAEASGLPFQFGLIRNHYVGRTFIQPSQANRSFGVKVKLNPVRPVVGGKRVVLIDDSIVRGTTSRKIVQMLRQAGAREIHMRISCPPIIGPCYYGIDTPSEEELIANHYDVAGIARFIGADTLAYLSLEALLRSVGDPEGREFCVACYTRDYPIPADHQKIKQVRILERATVESS